jgi:hypothetical protein
VVPSRVPAPRNITEIGGYINLLGTLNQIDMRSQVLAGILGVAGPNPPLGWIANATLPMVPLANDRPAGPLQRSIPVTIPVRSDFLAPLRAALQILHDQGCMVPFLGGPLGLPRSGTNALPPDDPLPYLGRVLTLVPGTALADPVTDALALVRMQGTNGPFEVAANAVGPASAMVSPGNFEALRCTATACGSMPLTGAKLVFVAPALAQAGFYPDDPPSQPETAADEDWARWTNVTGLVPGVTTLGDELSLLYSQSVIAGSVFSGHLGRTWDGTEFAAPA